jgi:CRP/FNR family cyclic AMP-dependent transcriptional regulator
MANFPENSDNYRFRQLQRVGLSDNICTSLLSSVSLRSYDASEIICKKGSDFEYWMFITVGLVASSVPTPSSKFSPISIYGESAWFGESSIINEQPSFEDYICLAPTEVMRFPKNIMLRLLYTEPEFSKYVTKKIAWRFQKSSEILMLMKYCNPAVRIVLGLAQIGEAIQFGSDQPPSRGVMDWVEIPVKQEVLAALRGVSRSLFSECILKLEAKGWLRVSYGKLELRRMAAWMDFSRSQRNQVLTDTNSSFDQLLGQLDSNRAPLSVNEPPIYEADSEFVTVR